MEIQESQFLETNLSETTNTKLQETLAQRSYDHQRIRQSYNPQPIFQQNIIINQENAVSEMEVVQENIKNKSCSSVLNEQESQEEIQGHISKYLQAQAIIQAESKQLIVAKETEEATLFILNNQIKEISDLTSTMEEVSSQLETEDQILKQKQTLLERDMNTLQQQVKSAEVIVEKFITLLANIRDSFKEYHNEYAETKTKHDQQKKEIAAWKIDISSKISDKKNNMKKKKNSNEALKSETLRYKKENASLQQKIIETEKRLMYLKKQDEQLLQRSERLELKIKDNKEKEEILLERKKNLEELKENLNQMEEDHHHQLEILSLKTSEKKESVAEVDNLTKELDTKIKELQEQNETNQIALDSKRTALEDLIKQKSQKEEDIKIIKENAAILAEKYVNERTPIEEKDIVMQGKIKDTEEENMYLKKKLSILKEAQYAKMQEKNVVLLEKYEVEKKIALQEILSMKLKDISARVKEKMQKKDELTEELKKLTDETPLQELLKKKAYLESSLNYYNEKYNNAKSQADSMERSLEEAEKNYDGLVKSVKTKQDEVDLLKKQLKTLGQKGTLSGILKPGTTPKVQPSSPKKVQFNSFVEVQSKSSDTISTNPEDNKRSDLALLFEMVQSKALQDKSNTKPVKRRQMNFDD